ncbi:hypothetical protein BKA80DRAFT_280791 [Phyllosticta citrichinensis]
MARRRSRRLDRIFRRGGAYAVATLLFGSVGPHGAVEKEILIVERVGAVLVAFGQDLVSILEFVVAVEFAVLSVVVIAIWLHGLR